MHRLVAASGQNKTGSEKTENEAILSPGKVVHMAHPSTFNMAFMHQHHPCYYMLLLGP